MLPIASTCTNACRTRSISASTWCGSMRCISALQSSMSPGTQIARSPVLARFGFLQTQFQQKTGVTARRLRLRILLELSIPLRESVTSISLGECVCIENRGDKFGSRRTYPPWEEDPYRVAPVNLLDPNANGYDRFCTSPSSPPNAFLTGLYNPLAAALSPDAKDTRCRSSETPHLRAAVAGSLPSQTLYPEVLFLSDNRDP
jgi:hypothetical protein